jgi:hypothetical protein
MTKSNLIKNTNQNKTKQYIAAASILAATIILPEISFAAGGSDAFLDIHTKITGWVSGTAGKLITFICFAMAGIMGVAGFPTKYILGAMGTGLLLSSSGSIVDMLFV